MPFSIISQLHAINEYLHSLGLGFCQNNMKKRYRFRKIRKIPRMLLNNESWTIWIRKVVKTGGGMDRAKGDMSVDKS